MTTPTILQSIAIGVLIFNLAACSGGDGTEPIPPPQAVNEPTDPPANPPPPDPPTTPPPPTKPPTIPRDPPTPPPPTVQLVPTGIWHGQTKREGRSVLGVVLKDGRSWFVYSVPTAPDWAGGAVVGKMAIDGATWKMDDALYIDTWYHTRATLDAEGTGISKQQLQGNFQITYGPPPSTGTPPHTTDGVDLVYAARSSTALDMRVVMARYNGLLIPLQDVSIVLMEDGAIMGTTANGCTFGGKFRPIGPVAEGSITFDGPPCQHGTATLHGMLDVDLQTGEMTLVAVSQDRSQVFVFIGQR